MKIMTALTGRLETYPTTKRLGRVDAGRLWGRFMPISIGDGISPRDGENSRLFRNGSGRRFFDHLGRGFVDGPVVAQGHEHFRELFEPRQARFPRRPTGGPNPRL